jgi:hypothetical protein
MESKTTAVLTRALALAGALLLAVPAALAQAPKVGPQYERSDLGFRIKRPAEWMLIPPQPGDPNLLAKFKPENVEYVQVGTEASGRPIVAFLEFYVLKFDRRKTAEEGGPALMRKPLKDVKEWVKKGGDVQDGPTMKVEEEKDFTAAKIAAKEIQFVTPGDEKSSRRAYAATYALSPELDVAIVATGPGAKAKWPKYEAVFQQMARSFSAIATETAASVAADAPVRDKERARLQGILSSLGGGWKLYETPNYFVLTPHEDRAFIDELCGRLEAIRAIYEQDYPAEKAEQYRKAGEAARTGESAEDKAKREAEEKVTKALFGEASPREMSRCSVVRVFTDQSAYHSYGGPQGSAGYWSPMVRELVLYDDQKGGGRRDTWAVLNHEAFHQFIFYFYGNISPHSWYNEGTGDFYSGYEYKNKRFTLKKFDWRVGTIQEAVRPGSDSPYIPLKDFVRLSQAEYYGNNKWKVGGGQNYAQGWSLIYFLRTGKKNNAKGWDPAWDGILETYLRVLAMSGDVDQAVTEAYKGVDFDALEQAWKDYTK